MSFHPGGQACHLLLPTLLPDRDLPVTPTGVTALQSWSRKQTASYLAQLVTWQRQHSGFRLVIYVLSRESWLKGKTTQAERL